MSQNTANLSEQNQLESYYAFSRKVLQFVNEDIKANRLSGVKALVIIIQLSNAQTREELVAKIEELAKDYPNLKDILLNEEAVEADKKDDLVEAYTSYLIKSVDPVQATEFTAFAQENDLEAIYAKYPEFKTFNQSA